VILTNVPKKSENTKGEYKLEEFVLSVQKKLQNPLKGNIKINQLSSYELYTATK